MLDFGGDFGKRVAARLRDEIVIWLTTVDAKGTPQPIPVWFFWDGETFLIYSQPDTAKLRNIERNPRVALHFDGNGRGGDIVVFTGDAYPDPTAPPASQVKEFVAKYDRQIRRIGYADAEGLSREYSVPIRVKPTKLRGF